MSQQKEYKTTCDRYEPGGRYIGEAYLRDIEAPDPVEPSGEGWELVGTAADGGILFWTWERAK